MVLLKDLKADELRRELEDAELETDGKKSELVKRLRAHLEQQGYDPDTYQFSNEFDNKMEKIENNMKALLIENSSRIEEKIENKLENMQVENDIKMEKRLMENENKMEKLLVENKTEMNKMLGENENKMKELLENSTRMEESLKTEVLQMKNKMVELSSELENRVIEHAEQKIRDGFVNIKQELEIQAAEVRTLKKELESKLETTTQIPVMNRDTVKPPEYDGKSPWTNYHLQFEAAAIKNHWDDQDKATHLIVALRGDAANVLQAVPVKDMNDYDKLVKCLETRFGIEHLQGVYHCQLRARKQKYNESLQEYQLDINRLMRLAYPDTSDNTLECLAVQAFADGLYDPEIKQAVLLSRSKSISAALSCALEYEAVKIIDLITYG